MKSSRIRTVLALAVVAMAAIAFTAASANAEVITLRFDNFDNLAGGAADYISNTTNEPLSAWTEVSARYKPVYFGGTPAATTGNARADQAGLNNLGKGVRVRSSNGAMCLDAPMLLDTLNATSVTISFDLKEHTLDYHLDLQYSALGNFTDAVTLDHFWGAGTLDTWVPKSYTLTDGQGGITFTDTAQFMIRKVSGGNGGANATFHTFDNMLITAVVPEPATMGLLAIGGLALLRRRRRA